MHDIINLIKPSKNGDNIRPHKYALLLAIIKLYELNPNRDNIFMLDDELKKFFREAILILQPNIRYYDTMIEAPFYYLSSDEFWILHVKENKKEEFRFIKSEKNSRFTQKRILEIFSHASLKQEIHEMFKHKEIRDKVYNDIISLFQNTKVKETNDNIQTISFNPFITYLNSLQRLHGDNKNSLAEFQSTNTYFPRIHVKHPLAAEIIDKLSSEKKLHVIITGHAGDGKSTLALEIYRHFKGIKGDEPLDEAMKIREDIGGISIIKDLSERDEEDDKKLLEEIIDGNQKFVLISNTGTLLNIFRKHSKLFTQTSMEIESNLLTAISKNKGYDILKLGETEFHIFNLALIDNLPLARAVFEKMLNEKNWGNCEACGISENCPIYQNILLIRRYKERITERLFLCYRRMYEYGYRLTMRQYTEHLAYILTSGKDCSIVSETGNKDCISGKYMFFNRFFGDDGIEEDNFAQMMAGVRNVNLQGFGSWKSDSWERRLWQKSNKTKIMLNIGDKYEKLFEILREAGRDRKNEQVREQVRRMFFFLYDFKESKEKNCFLSCFLNSPNIVKWYEWQQDKDYSLTLSERQTLNNKIFHVVQEYFAGIRIPEGAISNDKRLYITLSRQEGVIRQTAQIIIALIDWNENFRLELEEFTPVCSDYKRKDLVLKGINTLNGINLPLDIPFLDYVTFRGDGRLTGTLQSSYIQRLNNFKNKILQKHREKAGSWPESQLKLVRMHTDHKFHCQNINIDESNSKVEATNG